jgi:RNA recognition motif-containing protein
MTTLHVANLPFSVTEDEVRELFQPIGPVQTVRLVHDVATGKPRGFCFVEMPDEAAGAAMQALNGHELHGRPLRINPAQSHTRLGGGPFRR